MGHYLEIAKRALELAERNQQVVTSEPTPLELPVADPYAERIRVAFRQVNPPDYPTGMIPWLGTVHSDLYAELTSNLPDEIQRLWSERAPLEQFEAVLARLVSIHRWCCDLYRVELTESSSGNR